MCEEGCAGGNLFAESFPWPPGRTECRLLASPTLSFWVRVPEGSGASVDGVKPCQDGELMSLDKSHLHVGPHFRAQQWSMSTLSPFWSPVAGQVSPGLRDLAPYKAPADPWTMADVGGQDAPGYPEGALLGCSAGPGASGEINPGVHVPGPSRNSESIP